MCRVLTALLFLVLTVTAQTAAQDTDEYRLKVDRLADRFARLQESILRAESLPPLDTVTVRRLHMLTRPQRSDFFRQVGLLAWDSLAATLGSDTVLIEDAYLHLREGTDPRLRIPDIGEYYIGTGATPESAALGLVQATLPRIWGQAPDDLRRWLPTPSGFGPLPQNLVQVVYTDLVTAPWANTKACYGGDLGACARALALESSEQPLSLWFTIDEQRRVILNYRSRRIRSEPDYIACTDGDDASCTALLVEHPYLIRTPLAHTARESILRVALEVGGDGTMGRLIRADPGSVGEQLARATRVSQDSLVAVWRARILAAEPGSTTLTRVAGWTAFAWILVITVIATRSTRWRSV